MLNRGKMEMYKCRIHIIERVGKGYQMLISLNCLKGEKIERSKIYLDQEENFG